MPADDVRAHAVETRGGTAGITLVVVMSTGSSAIAARAVGVIVDGRTLPADLVIDASGRSSRFTDAIRPPAEGGDCGAVYVTRQYRLHDGADAGPMNSPIGLSLGLSGYWAIAFLHDNGAFSITFTHDGTDKRLRLLRHDEVFDDAVRAIPLLAEWIDSVTRTTHFAGVARRPAVQQLPRTARRRGQAGAARADLGRRRGVHDNAAGRARGDVGADAGTGTRSASLTCTIVISQRRQCNSTAGARTTSGRGSTTTATPTPIGCADGPAGTSTSAAGCRPT